MTTAISQKEHDTHLSTIFASTARVVVLRVFMLDPFRAYYQRQIEAATGQPIRAIQRELDRFSSTGLLYRRNEGNRTYYQVDTHFPLFPELRSMMLKTGTTEDRLRGGLAAEPAVRLALLNTEENRVLVVTTGGKFKPLAVPDPYRVEVINEEEFTRVLSDNPTTLEAFLVRGTDMLGRREDVLWRRIEAAGYQVPKGKGIP